MSSEVSQVEIRPGQRVEVHRSGSGPVVLLNGGLGQPAQVWEYTGVTQALATAGFSTIAHSARGVAPSSAPPGPYTAADLADDAAALLDVLAIDDVIVVGYSMGCYVTQELIRRHPGRVRATALVAGIQPSPIGELVGRMEIGLLDTYGTIPADVMTFEQLVTTLHPALLQDAASVRGWSEIFASSGEVWTDDEGLRGNLMASYSWITADEPTPERLSAIDIPTLVLAFEHDLFFPPAGCRAASEKIPGSRFAVVEGVGHGGFFTGQTDAVARIVDFCTDFR
ncbi:alpha/beta fold hydrolase [Williamsia deligens]|uniref:Alpha/beta fold hydrolase n=1 Tax=Williamsia deligens TaxID=321325 RepID=A0ABW3G662_9NOCA|nr:alpha/beta hydrolase [Williamsia deligens]MCP2194139.1 thioesterase CepJ [Williamsia deligens]